MADRSITIALEARVQGFVSGLKTAQQVAKDFGDRTASFARENEQHLDRVGKAGMVMGGTLLAGVGLAVKAAMDFDAAMSEVRASTHETAANMDLLRQAAIDAGADTSFSAKEAASGIDELAKAGVSTKDVLSGGLTGALSLAAAGSLGVGDAAEIAATALTQFKLQGKDIPHVADLLAAGAGKAQGSVEDIGGALKQSGLVASQFGLSLEDTTGTLAAFASAGLVGSDSGTSLKTMLLKLASPSKEAAEMMANLGIAAYDSGGKFVGVTDLAGQLQTKLGGLTQAQRDSTLATIFGTDAIRGANVLYEQGAKGIGGWIGKVNEAGYAAVTASIKQDNLAGDLEKLGGSFDSLLIKSGSGLSESLRGLVQGAEDLVDAIGKIPGPALNAGVGIAGVVGGAALLGGAVITMLPKFVEFGDSLEKIAPKGSKASAAIRGVGKAAGIAATAMIALQIAGALFTEKDTKSAEDYGQAILKVAKAGDAASAGSGLDSVFKKWDKFAGEGPDIRDLAGAVKEITNPHIPAGVQDTMDAMFAWTGSAKNDLGQVRDTFKGLGDEMGGLVKNGSADTAAKTFQELTKEFEKNGKGAKEALDAVPGYEDALQGLANQAGVTVEGQDLLNFAMGKVPASMAAASQSTEGQAKATEQAAQMTDELKQHLEDLGINLQGRIVDLDKFAQSLFAAGLMSLSSSDAAIAYQDAIDKVSASALQNGQTLDINTEAGRANQGALNDLAKAGIASMEAMAKETDANGKHVYSQAQLQGSLRTTYDDLISSAGQFGITGDAADTLARKALGIPKKANIDTWMDTKARAEAEKTKAALDAIPKSVVVNTVYNETTIQKVIRELSGGDPPVGAGTVLAPPPAKKKKAGGGPVFGPGTGTSDDIPAMLSNGEHVWTAQEVADAGGQGAMYRMRAMAKAGLLPKFATGGAAERRREAIKYQTDARRGNGYRSVTESLSSAYSFADRLTSLADSGNVSAAAIRNLYTAAGRGEAGLKALHGRADKLSASLDLAKSKLGDLTQVRDRIKDNLAGGFSIGDAVKRGNMYGSASMKDVQGSASGYLSKVQSFAGKLKAMQRKGYSGAIVQEIAEMGLVEGAKAADVLLKATAGEVKSLNKTKTAIDSASMAAGNYVTDAMYKGGVNAAAGLVKGLQSQEQAIEKQMLKIGLGMETALKKALGIRSPSRKAAAIGDNFTGTLTNRLAAGAGEVAKQAGALGDAMSIKPAAVGYRYSPAQAPRLSLPSQNTAGGGGATFGDVHITQQSDPVATYHEFSRRTRRLST